MRNEKAIFAMLAQERAERAAYRRNLHLPAHEAAPWMTDEHLPCHVDVHFGHTASLGSPPERHGGVRKTHKSSEANWTGSTYFSGREIQIESGRERKVATLLMADPNTKELRSQPHRLTYKDENGVEREHTLDYLQLTRSGERIGHAVKTEKGRRALEKIVGQIMAGEHRGIDRIEVWTEADIPDWKFHNAVDFNWARDNYDERDADLVRSRASRFGHTVELWQLYDRGIHHWGRRAAILRMIEQGELRPVNPDERISEISKLRIRLRC